MADRFSLLVGFSTLLVLYILWIDFRPFVQRWRERRRHHPVSIAPQVYAECVRVNCEGEETDYYQSTFYLVIHNNTENGATLRQVQAHVVFTGAPVTLNAKGFAHHKVDIRHGESVFFEIGHIVSKNGYGLIQSPFSIDFKKNRVKAYEHNQKGGYVRFELPHNAGSILHVPGKTQDISFPAIFAAEDIVAKKVWITFDIGDSESPVKWSETGLP